MALKKTVNFNGIDVVDAYHRVESVRTSGKAMCVAEVKSYAPNASGLPFASSQFACPYDMTSDSNVFKQSYKHIKTLPQFENSIDC